MRVPSAICPRVAKAEQTRASPGNSKQKRKNPNHASSKDVASIYYAGEGRGKWDILAADGTTVDEELGGAAKMTLLPIPHLWNTRHHFGLLLDLESTSWLQNPPTA
jgi:hypothetical protein